MGKNRQKANLTSNLLITTDIVNDRIGIGTTTPSTSLSVVGIVSATSFYGDGSNISGISGGVTTGKAIAMAIVFGWYL